MNPLRTTRANNGARFVGSAGATRARADSGFYPAVRPATLAEQLEAANARAAAAEAEAAVLRAELDIQASNPAARR